MNIYKTLRSYFRDTPLIFLIFGVMLALLVSAVIISIEDFTTSLMGYQSLPTRKVYYEYVKYAVAVIPQMASFAFFLFYLANVRNKKFLWISAALWMVDAGTDIYYKANGLPPEVWVIALFESLLIFTMLSELLLSFSFGVVLEFTPEVFNLARRYWREARAAASGGQGPAAAPGFVNNNQQKPMPPLPGQHGGQGQPPRPPQGNQPPGRN